MLGISLTLCVLFLRGVSGVETDRVTVNEGDTVTLNTNVKINQKDRIRWFFENTRIAQIIGNISICTDVQCNEGTERFRDRLMLDHQTGSLTIRDIRSTETGLYELQVTSNTDSLKIFNVTFSGAGVSVSVMEGDSVTLHTDVKTNQQDRIRWYYNDTQIAQINRVLNKTCTDVQCNEGTERFRDRLKLDHQTGSLTITNINTTDSGVYHLQIISRNNEKIFNVAVHDVPAAEQNEIKMVKEGESVTLDPGVVKNPNDVMTWYYNDVLITEISGDQSQICTDDQCKERFRDRLKLDHQTGSLTITNTTNTDAGEYKLKIISSSDSEKIFSVTVIGVSAAERDEVKRKSVMEGESVTLDPGVMKNTDDSMTWYFNETLIAEITGDQSQICTDDQCEERFRDRLKLDHQTGSLTIMNIRTTDSGDYQLQIISSNSRFSITRGKRFNVSVTGSGLSSAAVAGICAVAAVLLVFAAAVCVIYYRHRSHTAVPQNEDDNLADNSPPNSKGVPLRKRTRP